MSGPIRWIISILLDLLVSPAKRRQVGGLSFRKKYAGRNLIGIRRDTGKAREGVLRGTTEATELALIEVRVRKVGTGMTRIAVTAGTKTETSSPEVKTTSQHQAIREVATQNSI